MVAGVAPADGDDDVAMNEPFATSIFGGQMPEMKLAFGLPKPDAMS